MIDIGACSPFNFSFLLHIADQENTVKWREKAQREEKRELKRSGKEEAR